jgi:predicted transcriptional regulator
MDDTVKQQTDHKLAFAKFLKAKRTKKKISVATLASTAGISKAFVYLVEQQTHSPSIDTAGRMLDSMGESWASFSRYVNKSV